MGNYGFLKRSNHCFVIINHTFAHIIGNKAEHKSGKFSYAEFEGDFIYISLLMLLKMFLIPPKNYLKCN